MPLFLELRDKLTLLVFAMIILFITVNMTIEFNICILISRTSNHGKVQILIDNNFLYNYKKINQHYLLHTTIPLVLSLITLKSQTSVVDNDL